MRICLFLQSPFGFVILGLVCSEDVGPRSPWTALTSLDLHCMTFSARHHPTIGSRSRSRSNSNSNPNPPVKQSIEATSGSRSYASLFQAVGASSVQASLSGLSSAQTDQCHFSLFFHHECRFYHHHRHHRRGHWHGRHRRCTSIPRTSMPARLPSTR